ncbi:MAG: hypothetical protein U1F43_28930 [Myxococcota bacterium]
MQLPDADRADADARALEQPTGSRAIRGPTAFVLGLMLLTAVGAIVRSCLA